MPLFKRGTRQIRQHRVGRQLRKHKDSDEWEDNDGDAIASWDDLLLKLEANQLDELALGWHDSNYRLKGRRLAQLEEMLKKNTSVTKVKLGWRVHHRSPEVLVRLLKALPSRRLTELQLVLDEWVPEVVLRNLLRQQPKLRSLEFESVQVFRRNALGQVCCDQASGGSHQIAGCVQAAAVRRAATRKANDFPAAAAAVEEFCQPIALPGQGAVPPPSRRCDHNIVIRVLEPLLPHQYFSELESLVLQDVRMDDRAAQALSDWTHISRGLKSLSLRGNKGSRCSLGPRGLTLLCQANVSGHLDLSLCDLDMFDVQAVAAAIAQRTDILGSLSLAGNYRMDTPGLLSLVEPSVCEKLRALDVSFCDVGDHRATLVLEKLCGLAANNSHKKIALEQFVMLGGRIVCRQAIEALCQLLRINTPLRVLRVHHPTSPTYLSSSQVALLVDALQDNYEMETLVFDWRVETRLDLELQERIRLILALNDSGRRLFRNNAWAIVDDQAPPAAAEAVSTVLARAGQYESGDENNRNSGDRELDRLNLVYWMVRQSPMHIVSSMRPVAHN